MKGTVEDGDKWIRVAYLLVYKEETLSLRGEDGEVVVVNNVWQRVIFLKFMLHWDSQYL